MCPTLSVEPSRSPPGAFPAPPWTDLNVFVEEDRLQQVFDVFEALGVEVDRSGATSRHRRDGMFVLVSPEGVRIDVFTPSIAFSWEAARTRVRVPMLGADVAVLSAEALAVFKLLFFRTKDIADLERLLATQAGGLDHPYVRGWLVDMMGEDDPRVAKWDDLVQAFGCRADT